MTHLQESELREKLAAIEHERWAQWQAWCHSQGREEWVEMDGKPELMLCIPMEIVSRWNRQIETPYAELSDKEKASDMEQVDRYWPLVSSYAASQRQEGARQGALNALVQLKADRINHTLTRPADEWETWMQFIDKRIEKYNVPQDTEEKK